MNYPAVSVIIPVYNVAAYVGQCARSLFSQTLEELEFIFIDDNSRDESISIIRKVLEDFPQREKQVKFLIHSENQGVSKSRQDGLDIAIGEYIIHCDPDDWVAPEAYEILFNEAKKENIDILICDYYEVRNNNQLFPQKLITNDSEGLMKGICGTVSPSVIGTTWNKLIKKEIAKNSSFDPSITYCEDTLYLFEILRNNLKIATLNRGLYYYRYREDGLVRKSYGYNSFLSDLKLIEKIEELKELTGRPSFNKLYDSKISAIVLNKLLSYENVEIKELKRLFRKYSSNLLKKKNYNPLHKLLCWTALNINYKISRNIFWSIKNIRNIFLYK